MHVHFEENILVLLVCLGLDLFGELDDRLVMRIVLLFLQINTS